MGMGKENVSAEPHRSPDPVQTALPMTHMLLPYSCVLDPLPLVCYRMKDGAGAPCCWGLPSQGWVGLPAPWVSAPPSPQVLRGSGYLFPRTCHTRGLHPLNAGRSRASGPGWLSAAVGAGICSLCSLSPTGVLLEEASPSALPALPGLSSDALSPLLMLHPD